jgi:hypothetical protein
MECVSALTLSQLSSLTTCEPELSRERCRLHLDGDTAETLASVTCALFAIFVPSRPK